MLNYCSECGGRVIRRTWQDDICGSMRTVETLAKCVNGCFRHHDAYGESAGEEDGNESAEVATDGNQD
jgi:hypothetical protein